VYLVATDLIINGSFWLGTMFGAALSLVLLDTDLFAPNLGWRIAFGLGAVLGLGILLVRRNVPESPRWLFIHGRNDQAEELVGEVELQVEEQTGKRLDEVADSIKIRQRTSIGFGVSAHTAFRRYPRRTVLGLALFVGQAFLYNAVVLHPGAADRHGAAVQRRGADGHHPDRLLGGGVLPRLGRGQRRLPHRQRDLPDGDQGHGPGLLLRRRHRHRRGHRAGAVRQAGRDRQGDQRLLRLPDRRAADDRGRDRRVVHRRRGGRQVPGGRGQAADRRGGGGGGHARRTDA
jgi:Sugar (and other) transporter